MVVANRTLLLFATLPLMATTPSCNPNLGPPTGTYKVDTVEFVANPAKSKSSDPAPSVWIDTNTKLSSLAGGTLKSHLPYSLAIDYTDSDATYENAEFTSVSITYDDATVEPAIKNLPLPVTLSAKNTESVNSVAGGRIVKSVVRVISGKIPDVVTSKKSFTLEMKGHFTGRDGTKTPFAIDQHFDAKIEKGKKSTKEVLQDK